MAQQNNERVDLLLINGGYGVPEIKEYLQPKLLEAGYTDQEINAHFVGLEREQKFIQEMYAGRQMFTETNSPVGGMLGMLSPKGDAGHWDSFVQGTQGSVEGLATRRTMPNALRPEQVQELSWSQRLAMQAGTLLGDIPSMAVGSVAGASTGPAAPIAMPAAAFAYTEGRRAIYMQAIEKGEVQNAAEFIEREKIILGSTAKGAVVGAATGAAGLAGGTLAKTLGAGAMGQTATRLGAEIGTMPTAGAALEGRLPEPQEFVDAALLIGTLGGLGVGVQRIVTAKQQLTPKLRAVFEKTGKQPEQVLIDAKQDATVLQDMLSTNRPVPEKYATDILEKLKAGEEVPLEEVSNYKERPWAQAVLNESAGPEVIKNKLGQLAESVVTAKPSGKREAWAFVRQDEAALLAEKTGLPIEAGFTHTIDDYAIQHVYKQHGNAAMEATRGQLAITPQDIQRIPEIITSSAPEYVGKNAIGRDVLRYEQRLDSEQVIVVEEVRTKRNQLAFQTMYKIKATKLEPASVHTSETLRDMLPSSRAEVKGGDLSVKNDIRDTENVKPQDMARAADRQTSSNTDLPSIADRPVLSSGEGTGLEMSRLSDVVSGLAEYFDIPVRVGNIPYPEAQGLYKVAPEVIRTRVANEISTISHEIGHHLQKTVFGGFEGENLRPFADELLPIATNPRAGQSALPEGFAEFVARYITNPASAKEAAPRFFAQFERDLSSTSVKTLEVLQKAQEGVRKYVEQPALLEAQSHIRFGDEGQESFMQALAKKETWTDLKDRFAKNFIDRLDPLKQATESMRGNIELAAQDNPYVLARVYAGAVGKGTYFLEKSPFSFNSYADVGKPFKTIVKEAEQLGDIKDFSAYLVSKRALELEQRGIRSGMRLETAQAVVEKLGKKYDGLAKDVVTYQDHLVQYLVDAGVLGKKEAGAMREANQSYVPFKRMMDDAGGALGTDGGLSAKNPVKRIKGSGRDILDPLESIVENTYHFIDMAERNAVGRALVDLASNSEGSGWLVEKIPVPKKATTVHTETILKAVKDNSPEGFVALKDALGEGADLTISVFAPSTFIDKANQISVLRNGKRELYQVSPEIAEVMNNLGAEHTSWLLRFLSFPTKVLRAGATLAPEFMVRNIIRDTMESGVKSGSGFVPFVDSVRGLSHALKRDDMYWRWKKSGGDQAHFVSMDRTTLHKNLTDMQQSGVMEKVWNTISNPLEALRIVSELSEQATRLGEFAKAEKLRGTDKSGQIQAALDTRDVSIDFARTGNMMRIVNSLVPFTNAQVQSMWRLGEVAKVRTGKTALKLVAYITAPSVALAIHNYEDDDIRELPAWQRDLFWCFKIPFVKGYENPLFKDTIMRIPKPFEVGVVFGSIPERLTWLALDAHAEMTGKGRKETAEDTLRGLGGSLWDVATPSFVPTFATPFVEQFSNRKIMFDRPVIPADREGMLPEYQYSRNTTELTKALSKFVGVHLGQSSTFSPAVIENFIQDWSGGLGMQALQLADMGLRKAGILADPVKPTTTLADTPVVRAFFARNPSMSAESIDKFRKSYEEAQSYLKTITGLQKELKYDDVAPYLPYSTYKAMDGPHQALSNIMKFQRMVQDNPDISSDEKRQLLDDTTRQAIGIAKQGNEVFKAVKGGLRQMAKDKMGH